MPDVEDMWDDDEDMARDAGRSPTGRDLARQEEEMLLRHLSAIQRSYKKSAQPIIDRLVEIRAAQPPAPVYLDLSAVEPLIMEELRDKIPPEPPAIECAGCGEMKAMEPVEGEPSRVRIDGLTSWSYTTDHGWRCSAYCVSMVGHEDMFPKRA